MIKKREMFIAFDSLIAEKFKLSVVEFIIYSIIYTYTKDGKGTFFASKDYIYKNFGISQSYAYKTIRKLIKLGLVEDLGAFSGRKKKYRVNLEVIKNTEIEDKAEEEKKDNKDNKYSSSRTEAQSFSENQSANVTKSASALQTKNTYNIYNKGKETIFRKYDIFGPNASYNRYAYAPLKRKEYNKEIEAMINCRINKTYEEYRKRHPGEESRVVSS